MLYHLWRVGEHGEGKFERDLWDETLETVTRELMRIRDTYGLEAILMKASAGDIVALHGPADTEGFPIDSDLGNLLAEFPIR